MTSLTLFSLLGTFPRFPSWHPIVRGILEKHGRSGSIAVTGLNWTPTLNADISLTLEDRRKGGQARAQQIADYPFLAPMHMLRNCTCLRHRLCSLQSTKTLI
jgi:hypothetical protein